MDPSKPLPSPSPSRRFIVMAIVSLSLGLISFAPPVVLIVGMLTLGLGFLLFMANNTLLIYAISVLPVLAAFAATDQVNGGRRGVIATPVRLISIIGVVGFVAWFVPFGINAASEAAARRFHAGDGIDTFVKAPHTIEIIIETGMMGPDPQHATPCQELCQKLLASEKFEMVRVRQASITPSLPLAAADYTLEPMQPCPDVFAQGTPIDPGMMRLLSEGVCLVMAPFGDAAMDAIVRMQHVDNIVSPDSDRLRDIVETWGAPPGSRLARLERVEIFETVDLKAEIRYRKTSSEYFEALAPLHASFAPCYGLCVGTPMVASKSTWLNRIDPVGDVLTFFDIAPTAANSAPDPATLVLKALQLAGPALTQADMRIITDWATPYAFGDRGARPLSGPDREATLTLIADSRVSDFLFIGAMISRRREFATENLDAILTRIEQQPASRAASQLGMAISDLPSTVFMPYRERLVALLPETDWSYAAGLYHYAGHLGAESTSMIAAHLADPKSIRGAAIAACLADPAILQALVPDLLAAERRVFSKSGPTESAGNRLMLALARADRFDEAKKIFAEKFAEKDQGRLNSPPFVKVKTNPGECGRW